MTIWTNLTSKHVLISRQTNWTESYICTGNLKTEVHYCISTRQCGMCTAIKINRHVHFTTSNYVY